MISKNKWLLPAIAALTLSCAKDKGADSPEDVDDGPMEEAGESADDTVEDAEESLEEVGEEIEETVEDAEDDLNIGESNNE